MAQVGGKRVPHKLCAQKPVVTYFQWELWSCGDTILSCPLMPFGNGGVRHISILDLFLPVKGIMSGLASIFDS